MRGRFSRWMLAGLSALTLGGTVSGCFVHGEDWEYDHDHRRYRRERWRDEDVYRREDGRWYARRHGGWVVVEGVTIE